VSDELIARLREACRQAMNAQDSGSEYALLREAADRIERMEAAARDVVAAWRRSEHIPGNDSKWPNYMLALDAQITDTTHADKVRCPNCSEKDASIAELIETLQRTEAAKEKA
jgi:hypothetical protein